MDFIPIILVKAYLVVEKAYMNPFNFLQQCCAPDHGSIKALSSKRRRAKISVIR